MKIDLLLALDFLERHDLTLRRYILSVTIALL